jgi:tight adherence protein C
MLKSAGTLAASIASAVLGYFAAVLGMGESSPTAGTIGSIIGLTCFFATFFIIQNAADDMDVNRRIRGMKVSASGVKGSRKIGLAEHVGTANDGRIAALAEIANRALGMNTEQRLPKLRQLLVSAGHLRDRDIFVFVVTQFALLLFGLVLGLLCWTLGYGLYWMGILPGIGFYGPVQVMNSKAKKRREQIFLQLPDAIDLIVIYAESGHSFDSALGRVIDVLQDRYPTIAGELRVLEYELNYFTDRTQAFENMVRRCPIDMIRRLSAIVQQSEQIGTPVSESLKELAKDSRLERFMDAERRAAKVPVLMNIPVVLFILPSLFVFVLGPVGMKMVKLFSGM